MTDKEFKTMRMRAITAVVMGALDDAFAAFRANPGGPGFGALHDAMWAAQFIKQSSHEDWIMNKVLDLPIGSWLEVIANQAKGQM